MKTYVLKPILENDRWLRFTLIEGGKLEQVETTPYDPQAESLSEAIWEALPADLGLPQVFAGFDFSINQRVCYCWGPAGRDFSGAFYRLRYNKMLKQPAKRYESFMQQPGSPWQFGGGSAAARDNTVTINQHQFSWRFIADSELPGDDEKCHDQVRGLKAVSQQSWYGDVGDHFDDLLARIATRYQASRKQLRLSEQQQLVLLENFVSNLTELMQACPSQEVYVQALIAALAGDFTALEQTPEEDTEGQDDQAAMQQLEVCNAARLVADRFIPSHINMYTPSDSSSQATIADVHEYLCQAVRAELTFYQQVDVKTKQRALPQGYEAIAAGKSYAISPIQLDVLGRMVASALEIIMQSNLINIGTKALYLKRAIGRTTQDYYALLDKLYVGHRDLELIKAFKLLHDLYFNEEVLFGVHGRQFILQRNFGSLGEVDQQGFQDAMRDMVNHRMREIAGMHRAEAESQSAAREQEEQSITGEDTWRAMLEQRHPDGVNEFDDPSSLPSDEHQRRDQGRLQLPRERIITCLEISFAQLDALPISVRESIYRNLSNIIWLVEHCQLDYECLQIITAEVLTILVGRKDDVFSLASNGYSPRYLIQLPGDYFRAVLARHRRVGQIIAATAISPACFNQLLCAPQSAACMNRCTIETQEVLSSPLGRLLQLHAEELLATVRGGVAIDDYVRLFGMCNDLTPVRFVRLTRDARIPSSRLLTCDISQLRIVAIYSVQISALLKLHHVLIDDVLSLAEEQLQALVHCFEGFKIFSNVTHQSPEEFFLLSEEDVATRVCRYQSACSQVLATISSPDDVNATKFLLSKLRADTLSQLVENVDEYIRHNILDCQLIQWIALIDRRNLATNLFQNLDRLEVINRDLKISLLQFSRKSDEEIKDLLLNARVYQRLMRAWNVGPDYLQSLNPLYRNEFVANIDAVETLGDQYNLHASVLVGYDIEDLRELLLRTKYYARLTELGVTLEDLRALPPDTKDQLCENVFACQILYQEGFFAEEVLSLTPLVRVRLFENLAMLRGACRLIGVPVAHFLRHTEQSKLERLLSSLNVLVNLVVSLAIPFSEIVSLPIDTLIEVLSDSTSEMTQSFLRPYLPYSEGLMRRLEEYKTARSETGRNVLSELGARARISGMHSKQQKLSAVAVMESAAREGRSAAALNACPAAWAKGLGDIARDFKAESDEIGQRIAACYIV